MVRKLAMFSFPPVILLTSLIFLRAVATGINISTPGDYAGLTRWVFDNVKGFRIGTAEIAKDDRVHPKAEHVSAEQQPELEIGGQQPKIIMVRRNGKGNFRSRTPDAIVKIGPGVYKGEGDNRQVKALYHTLWRSTTNAQDNVQCQGCSVRDPGECYSCSEL